MNDEELDIHIRRLLDVEPPAEQLARLKCFWTQRSQAERRRQHMCRGAALAAAMLAVAAVSVWQLRSGPPQQREVADRAAANDPIVRQPVVPRRNDAIVPIEMQQERDAIAAGRAPTTYERFVFSVHRREPAAPRSRALIPTINNWIDELVRNPDADVKQFIASSDVPADLERILLRRLARSTDVQKYAMLRLLAECGSTRSQPALLRLGRRVEFRNAAVATIVQIVGIEQLPSVVGATAHTGLRMALIRRLLTADSDSGLRGFLSLVDNSETRAEALAVADELPSPPLSELLVHLDNDDEVVRLTAAVVLGHINGPNVATLLVNRVTQKPEAGVEAWIAVLACRGPVAEEFLAYATRQPQLLAHVNSARVRWAQIMN